MNMTDHKFLTPAERDEAQARSTQAHKIVAELCHGTRRWTMSVPAEPERDPDLVIDAALRNGDRALADITELRDVIAEHVELLQAIRAHLPADIRRLADESRARARALEEK